MSSNNKPSNKKVYGSQRMWLYIVFVLTVSLFCIVIGYLCKNKGFGKGLFQKSRDIDFAKGIQYESTKSDYHELGTVISQYRYQEFGATDPESVNVGAPMVALTFDDGPNPDNTTEILKVLEENYSHATFFVVGLNAEKYPEILKQISDSGNELGNHTYGHKNLTELDGDGIDEQIGNVNEIVKNATGQSTTVIRPPYGAYDDSVLNQLVEPVVLWDLDTEDWDNRSAQKVVDNVMNNVKDGDIILMHDIYGSTAAAVKLLVPKLKEQGYQVVTVSDMAKYKGKALENHKAYGKINSGD